MSFIATEEGIVLPLRSGGFRKSRAAQDGMYFWDLANQSILLDELGSFLPRVVENQEKGEARFFKIVGGQELCGQSRTARRIPTGEVRRLEEALARLTDRLNDPHIAPHAATLIREFKLPDPRTLPECYRLYGSGLKKRLLILWGFERSLTDAIPATQVISAADGKPLWKSIWFWVILVGILAGLLLVARCANEAEIDETPPSSDVLPLAATVPSREEGAESLSSESVPLEPVPEPPDVVEEKQFPPVDEQDLMEVQDEETLGFLPTDPSPPPAEASTAPSEEPLPDEEEHEYAAFPEPDEAPAPAPNQVEPSGETRDISEGEHKLAVAIEDRPSEQPRRAPPSLRSPNRKPLPNTPLSVPTEQFRIRSATGSPVVDANGRVQVRLIVENVGDPSLPVSVVAWQLELVREPSDSQEFSRYLPVGQYEVAVEVRHSDGQIFRSVADIFVDAVTAGSYRIRHHE